MKLWRTILVSLIAVIFFVACGDATPTGDPNYGPYEICPTAYLIAPVISSPPDLGVVDSITPTLEWTYPEIPYPYNTETGTCHPEKFRLTLKKGPLFMEAMGTFVDGTQTSWTTPALEVGTEYRWSVSPMSGNENGPFSGIHSFFVGAPCTTEIPAPTLLQPVNGIAVNMQIPTLMWQSNSECIADAYHIDVATDMGFSDIVFAVDTDGPVTSYTIPNPLPPCERYYWRVASIKGGEIQPYSETYSFAIAIEGCEAEPGTGSITGEVWKDICQHPEFGEFTDPLPFGCIAHGDSAIADGNIQPGEPGIADVIVRVGSGTCSASSPLGLTVTNENGMFFLWSLQAGTYCLTIDPSENPIWLANGRWTYPPQTVDQPIGSWEITIASGENNSSANFGWQFDNGGPNPYNYFGGIVYQDECSISPQDNYSGDVPSNCRMYGGWITANGHQDEGEPGIVGVQVQARTQSCTGGISQTATTDENGRFAFLFEPGVVHCVTVDSSTTPNKEILKTGIWSWYPDSAIYTQQFYTENQSVVNTDYFNFAWEYSNQLFPLEVPDLHPKFKPDIGINCRAGPATFWQNWAFIEKGMQFQILAINPTRDWVQIQPAALLNPDGFPNRRQYDSSMKCWVKLDTGQVEGGLDDLEVHKGPSTPTPTPTPKPIVCSGLDKETCKNTPGCTWDESAAGIIGTCKRE